jgi:endogenous inhibitor of DNA gyrase (YacG/DUF329 family)
VSGGLSLLPFHAMSKPLTVRCPICRNPVKSSDPEFPFCSERCRTIDLGNWASGQYVISSPLKDTDENLKPESDGSPHTDDD